MNDRTESTRTKGLLELIGAALLREPQDREQLVSILRDAEQRDLLGSEALGMIESALHLSEMRARDVMTPEANIASVTENQRLEDCVRAANASEYSRFPVYSTDGERVVGMLLVKDLLQYFFEEQRKDFKLKKILRPAFFVPESKRLDSLLREFRATHNHLAIVINEYGSVAGLVTIEDVIEQIVGDIEDEHDTDDIEENIRLRGDGRFTVKAQTSLEDFNEYFGCDLFADGFDTIGGLILGKLGYLPERGEVVVVEGFEFTVLHADHRRLRLLEMSVVEGA